jgi:hypothetical protein
MIISLTKKPRKVSNTSWLSRPVNTGDAGLDRQDVVAFWLAYSFAFDDTEPLPAMFRRKALAAGAEVSSAATDNAGYTATPAGGLPILRVSNMTASYILACVLFLFAALDAALLTMARFSLDKPAVTWSAPEERAVETAALSPLLEAREDAQASVIQQAANDLLLKRLEAAVNASAEKPAEAAGICVVASLNCWKNATFIR